MGRGVMTVTDAVHVVYFNHEPEESDHWFFDQLLDDIRETIKVQYPSFFDCDSWDGREEHRILENEYARIVVCEYMGLVSVSLAVIEEDQYYNPYLGGIGRYWCERIVNNFQKLMDDSYNTLSKLGTMSNGVSVFAKRGD